MGWAEGEGLKGEAKGASKASSENNLKNIESGTAGSSRRPAEDKNRPGPGSGAGSSNSDNGTGDQVGKEIRLEYVFGSLPTLSFYH